MPKLAGFTTYCFLNWILFMKLMYYTVQVLITTKPFHLSYLCPVLRLDTSDIPFDFILWDKVSQDGINIFSLYLEDLLTTMLCSVFNCINDIHVYIFIYICWQINYRLASLKVMLWIIKKNTYWCIDVSVFKYFYNSTSQFLNIEKYLKTNIIWLLDMSY